MWNRFPLDEITRGKVVKHNCQVQRENLVTFLDFRLSQGSIATYCRWGGSPCVYTQRIFSRISWWKNVDNQLTFAEVIIKHQVAAFLWNSECTSVCSQCTVLLPVTSGESVCVCSQCTVLLPVTSGESVCVASVRCYCLWQVGSLCV